MTVEIPATVSLVPMLLITLGIILARIGDGPSVWMIVSLGCFLSAGFLLLR